MLNLGPIEILVVFALALVVLGPRKLPEMARHLGRFYGLVRRTTHELKHTLDQELLDEDRQARRQAAERRRSEHKARRLEKEEPLPEEQPQPQVLPAAEAETPEPVEQTGTTDAEEPAAETAS